MTYFNRKVEKNIYIYINISVPINRVPVQLRIKTIGEKGSQECSYAHTSMYVCMVITYI